MRDVRVPVLRARHGGRVGRRGRRRGRVELGRRGRRLAVHGRARARVARRAAQRRRRRAARSATTPRPRPSRSRSTARQWLTISAWFDAVNTTLPAGVWDVPDICANLTPPARAGAAGAVATAGGVAPAGAADGGADDGADDGAAAAAAPPPFPARFATAITTNISQPGYTGGDVLTTFAGDRARGPGAQLARTTYGNFHTVLVDCAAAAVYEWDLDGLDCAVSRVADGAVAPRVCAACALPFGVRDTYGGNYSTRLAPFAAPNGSAGVAWNASATETDAHTGATTWRGAEGARDQRLVRRGRRAARRARLAARVAAHHPHVLELHDRGRRGGLRAARVFQPDRVESLSTARGPPRAAAGTVSTQAGARFCVLKTPVCHPCA